MKITLQTITEKQINVCIPDTSEDARDELCDTTECEGITCDRCAYSTRNWPEFCKAVND